MRAVLGQQVSTAAARTHAARLVARHGEPVEDPGGGLTHAVPVRRARSPASTRPTWRCRAPVGGACSGSPPRSPTGRLDLGPGADRDAARRQLAALPGIGAWTAEIVAMRALGDPDAFPATDAGVRAAAGRLGLPATPAALRAPRVAGARGAAYAVQHLWGALDHPINHWPPEEQPWPSPDRRTVTAPSGRSRSPATARS